MTQRAKRCEQATRLCVAPEHCSAGFVQNLALHFLAQRNLWIATFTLVSQPPRAGLYNALQPVATPTQAVNQIAFLVRNPATATKGAAWPTPSHTAAAPRQS